MPHIIQYVLQYACPANVLQAYRGLESRLWLDMALVKLGVAELDHAQIAHLPLDYLSSN